MLNILIPEVLAVAQHVKFNLFTSQNLPLIFDEKTPLCDIMW